VLSIMMGSTTRNAWFDVRLSHMPFHIFSDLIDFAGKGFSRVIEKHTQRARVATAPPMAAVI